MFLIKPEINMDTISTEEIFSRNVIIPILYVIFSSLALFSIIQANKKSEKAKNVRPVIFMRLCGMVLFGLIPVLFLWILPGYTISQLGLNMNRFAGSLIWIVILGAFLISMNFFLTRNPKNVKNYPQIQKESWSFYFILINTLSWAGYLFAYEFMFRGLLLFPLVNHLGIATAIILNTILYSATHFYKGMHEVIGAIPLGIVFCLLTIEYGNIWIAFFSHLCLALSCEYFALFRQQKTGNLQLKKSSSGK